MFVIAGLGNPGRKYAQTRHNLGFITVDVLAEELGVKVNKIKHKALVGEGNLGGHKFMLVKPQTYMNLSGDSLGEIVDYYKLPPENLLVIYDDMDFETGVIRVRKKGSAGSHNGMRSIIGRLGTDQFPRIRIGIGGAAKDAFPGDIRDFVTGGFTSMEKEPLENAVRRAVAAAKCYMEDGIDKAMNRYNGNS
ncbi:MAG: aminoacyl-tRNA hydrolase [Anaerovoracaceae bacterium]|jgi:PTH1 family peptidyl-tRNA hydrolase